MKQPAAIGLLLLLLLLAVSPASAAEDMRNDATNYTAAITSAENLSETWQNLDDDYAFIRQGLIKEISPVIIQTADGGDVVNTSAFTFLSAETSPATIQNSLYQHAVLNGMNGLFKVTDTIYQVRGFDIATMSFIKGDTGWIIIDPLSAVETAKAAYDLVSEELGTYPVKAVIYTHSHVDHYQGVKGVASDEAVAAGEIEIIAPAGFMEHAISENVYAGNAMERRGLYMYGLALPVGEKGFVNAGLGTTLSSGGTASLIAPTMDITETGQNLTIDGVKMEFQMTPGSEAPAEMDVWFPEEKALCMAENCVGTYHNILTIRGAQVRDPLAWSNYLDEALQLYGGKAEVLFTSHNWPRFGAENVTETLKVQRDMYKYVHDQALNLINRGYTMDEISHMIALPDSLRKYGYTHEFYGTVQMAAKAVYQKYLGFYDGNPVHLYNPDPQSFSAMLVEYMGGAEAVLPKLKEDYAAGKYEEVATIAGYLVFANASNYDARYMQANALEQLGYQSVSGPYRNAYLSAAQDLRKTENETNAFLNSGIRASIGSTDVMTAMSFEQIFEYLAICLNADRAKDANITITLSLKAADGDWTGYLQVENSVLHAWEGTYSGTPDAAFSGNKNDFVNFVAKGDFTMEEFEKAVTVAGNKKAVRDFIGMLDTFSPTFNIIIP
ncbi:MAG: alkyl sulfatase dimerization domain-containing protein [Methanocorpusculum sp.]|nr:alkyl sulfatase dimerization domain-containing protein [Methanocorpusculum sp.]